MRFWREKCFCGRIPLSVVPISSGFSTIYKLRTTRSTGQIYELRARGKEMCCVLPRTILRFMNMVGVIHRCPFWFKKVLIGLTLQGDYYVVGREKENHKSWGFCGKECFLDEDAPSTGILRMKDNIHILPDKLCERFLNISLTHEPEVRWWSKGWFIIEPGKTSDPVCGSTAQLGRRRVGERSIEERSKVRRLWKWKWKRCHLQVTLHRISTLFLPYHRKVNPEGSSGAESEGAESSGFESSRRSGRKEQKKTKVKRFGMTSYVASVGTCQVCDLTFLFFFQFSV